MTFEAISHNKGLLIEKLCFALKCVTENVLILKEQV